MTDCIFCKIIKKELPCESVMETDDFLAFHDIQPVAPVHVLFVPKRHVATLNDLEEKDAEVLGKMIKAAADTAADQGMADSGYRLVINCNRDGGQEVFHLHLHLMGGRRLGGMASKR